MRTFIALAACLILPAVSHAQGCQGVRVQVGGCSGVTVAVGGCGGMTYVNAGCFGAVPVVRGNCSGVMATHRVVGYVQMVPAAPPTGEQKSAAKSDPKTKDAPVAAPQDAGMTFAIMEQPRRFFLRLPPRRVAVRVE